MRMNDVSAATENAVRTPKLAVVVGSGGIKSFAALALFEFLEAAGLVPDLLIGCSGGAITTCLRAAGYNAAQMQALLPELLDPALFAQTDKRALLGLLGVPFNRLQLHRGVIQPSRLQALYDRLFGARRLEELPIPTLVQVTDFNTGAGFVLEQGRVAEVLYASGALYPALPMVELEGRWLTDGGFTSPCPVLEAVQRHIDVILAVTIETVCETEPKSFWDLFNMGPSLCARVLTRQQMATAINLHHYEIIQINVRFTQPIEFWDFAAVPLVLETGRQAVAAQQAEILAALQNFNTVF